MRVLCVADAGALLVLMRVLCVADAGAGALLVLR